MKVFLYVMDALRPDYLSCYNPAETTSPNLKEFCQDATKFENAYSTTTWTKPAAASLLTGRYPRETGTIHQLDAFPDFEFTLPSELSAAGYETHCISSNLFVSEQFGFGDFDSIDVLQYDQSLHGRRKSLKDPGKQEKQMLEEVGVDDMIVPLSEDIHARVKDAIGKQADEFFLLWSIDTHGPYFVRGESSYNGNDKSDFIFEKDIDKSNMDHVKDLYRDMIRYNDEQFGNFISYLREEGMYDDSLIITIADHGESFGDHSKFPGYPIFGHTDIVYEECIRIPMMVKYPNGYARGQTIDQPVQITDIYPTVLDVLDESIQANNLSGHSLYKSDIAVDRPIFVESQITPSSIYSGAIRQGKYKYIKIDKPLLTGDGIANFSRSLVRRLWEPQTRLYNLEDDPNEQTNLNSRERTKTTALAEEFDDMRCTLERASVSDEQEQADITAERKEQLRLLGYSE
ncbi:sulfatase [Natrinema salsiterrestre]|uniref:Sulfatase n=1 Tax=Natrinema salsiterrestre TaxID=2950540 RepID=A0A9Q4Q0F2_9EURY|nr:sulfatase [Natrinema salsiterrestre]MDF9745859.1 sulfatase [Natrinema salsiterrestre]